MSATPGPSTFRLMDLWNQPISTLGMPAFAGGGKVARVYEIATPYDYTQLRTLKIVQSADVLTITSPYYPPYELRRNGALDWQMAAIQFVNALAAPQSNGNAPNMINHVYRVVAAAPSNGGFSIPSASVAVFNDFSVPGRYNRVTWTSTPGAVFYFVYKYNGSQWGLIGFSASGTSFDDDASVTPDYTAAQYSGPSPPPTAFVTAVAPATTGVAVVPTGAGAKVYKYVVTSLNTDATEESIASSEVSATNDLNIAGNFNTVKWPQVPGVGLYNVYKSQNGIFGFIGRANADCTFLDDNIVPDTATTPPIQLNPFNGDGNYPRAVSYHQQRRVFAGTINEPQTMWMTRSGTERNLGYSFPSRDDDTVVLRVVSREANTIRSLVPMNDLILLTSGGEWKCAAADSGAITPSNVSVQPQGYTGSSDVQPVTTDRTILFAQDRGGAIRELQFAWEQQGYQTSNVSILAPHLFDYHLVVQMAFSRSPLPSLWSVRNDGYLLGMTYVPEHEVRAWHQHTTDGTFESICCVAEGDEDVLYVIVKRFIAGRTVRYIERKHTRRFDTPSDQFFVDSGLTYDGAPTATINGLYHLEGKEVALLADGGVSPPQIVTNGSVSLDAPASKVQVGLPYVSQVKTLPLSIQTEAFGQGTVKNVNKVFLRVLTSNGFSAGPSFDKLRYYPTRFAEPYGSPPDLVTGEVPLTLSPTWQRDGSVCIQQDQPLSFMLLGMAIETATGS
ncbi:hypothetical protein [Variovorax sp. J31P207]|uniref:hypothetical protein n=1 Tax=Variovorax sp. J31P207 TaxID=3053510 RepID=UPI002574CC6B|nr:hypothetical protein [Variovorax sp. J31P207]MDM0072080.1 hypothetical protein [Variovorax sp. J31P207]